MSFQSSRLVVAKNWAVGLIYLDFYSISNFGCGITNESMNSFKPKIMTKHLHKNKNANSEKISTHFSAGYSEGNDGW